MMCSTKMCLKCKKFKHSHFESMPFEAIDSYLTYPERISREFIEVGYTLYTSGHIALFREEEYVAKT